MDLVMALDTILQYAFVVVSIAIPIVVYVFFGWLAAISIKSRKPHLIFLSVMAILFVTLILIGVGMEFIEYWYEISA